MPSVSFARAFHAWFWNIEACVRFLNNWFAGGNLSQYDFVCLLISQDLMTPFLKKETKNSSKKNYFGHFLTYIIKN